MTRGNGENLRSSFDSNPLCNLDRAGAPKLNILHLTEDEGFSPRRLGRLRRLSASRGHAGSRGREAVGERGGCMYRRDETFASWGLDLLRCIA